MNKDDDSSLDDLFDPVTPPTDVDPDAELDEDGNPIDPSSNEGDGDGAGDGAGTPDDSGSGDGKAPADGADPAKDTDGDDPPADGSGDGSDVKLSGIEKYLANFDIEGGLIAFDDGTTVPFSELDPDKQAEVLSDLHDKNVKSIEEKYGLDENEVGLINYLRTNNVKIEDYIETLAKDRVNTILAATEAETENFKDMADDAVYMKFLQKNNPDSPVEDLEKDLESAKALNTFATITDNLRNQFIAQQEAKVQEAKDTQAQEFERTLEEQRQEVVQAVSKIDNVAGITLNDDAKNSLLDQILQVNENGDPLFMEDAFSNPEDLFNAAFWYYYGPGVLEQREKHWKEENSRAFKRGRESALGTPTPHINFEDKTKGQGSDDDEDDWLTLNTQ